MAENLIIYLYLLFISILTSPVEQNTVRDDVLTTAANEVGVLEVGNNRGARVEEYLAVTGLGGGNPWCAAFVAWVYDSNGVAIPRSAAWSPSWFPSAKTVHTRGVNEFNYTAGDVFGIWYQSKKRVAHVGLIVGDDGDFVKTIEGNTNDEGSREGNGVWRRKRLKRQVYQVANWID